MTREQIKADLEAEASQKFRAARKAAAEGSQQLAEQFLAQGKARMAAAERM